MAASYLRRGVVGSATFSLFVRRLPTRRRIPRRRRPRRRRRSIARPGRDGGGRRVAAIPAAVAGRARRPAAGVALHRRSLAVREGTVLTAGGPLLEVTAPLPEAQVVETLLLIAVTYRTALASRAARCVLAAAGPAGGGLLAAPDARRRCGPGGGARRCAGGLRGHERRSPCPSRARSARRSRPGTPPWWPRWIECAVSCRSRPAELPRAARAARRWPGRAGRREPLPAPPTPT